MVQVKVPSLCIKILNPNNSGELAYYYLPEACKMPKKQFPKNYTNRTSKRYLREFDFKHLSSTTKSLNTITNEIMKNLSLIFTLAMLLPWQAAHSQNLIAVQNGNTPAFYTVLDSAIIHAQNGDTVYIPGGTFSLTVQVTKSLHIIGVGNTLDSTLATGVTKINGNLALIDEASYGSLMGVNLNGSITASGNISNFLVQRCSFVGLALSSNTNWSFIENLLSGSFSGGVPNGASNCLLTNNIIMGHDIGNYFSFTSSVFKNNIFLFQSGNGYYPINASNSTFENNIFISTAYPLNDVSNSSINNNLFVDYQPFYGSQENWGSDNILNQPQSTIFVNQTGNTFNYSHDYHLQPTSPGKNAGKDGTDIGIYGGAFPWKAGSVPTNPHIQYESVSGVGEDGNIHVVVKVAAQDR